jgi:hypothetical protein
LTARALENYWSEEELQERLILDNGISIPVKNGEGGAEDY